MIAIVSLSLFFLRYCLNNVWIFIMYIERVSTHLFRNRRLSIPVYTLYPRFHRRCNDRKCHFWVDRISCRSHCNNDRRIWPAHDTLSVRFYLDDWECAMWILAGQFHCNSLLQSRRHSPRPSLARSMWIASVIKYSQLISKSYTCGHMIRVKFT